MSLEDIRPVNVHLEPLMWGKPIPQLIDLELVQAYENCIEAEKKREIAKLKLSLRNITLPNQNPNYQALKDAIINELKKRNIEL